MSEKLEQVSSAIYACQFGTSLAGDFSEADAKMCARVAIEAMREPTKEMCNAPSLRGECVNGVLPTGEECELIWKAMIDAALKS